MTDTINCLFFTNNIHYSQQFNFESHSYLPGYCCPFQTSQSDRPSAIDNLRGLIIGIRSNIWIINYRHRGKLSFARGIWINAFLYLYSIRYKPSYSYIFKFLPVIETKESCHGGKTESPMNCHCKATANCAPFAADFAEWRTVHRQNRPEAASSTIAVTWKNLLNVSVSSINSSSPHTHISQEIENLGNFSWIFRATSRAYLIIAPLSIKVLPTFIWPMYFAK